MTYRMLVSTDYEAPPAPPVPCAHGTLRAGEAIQVVGEEAVVAPATVVRELVTVGV